MHLEEKEQYNLKYGIWNKKFTIEYIILLYNTKQKKDIS